MIRTTLAASPRRGRVLAAKAVTRLPYVSLTDGPVLRAVVGTTLVMGGCHDAARHLLFTTRDA